MFQVYGKLTHRPIGPSDLVGDVSKTGYALRIDTDFTTMVDGQFADLHRGDLIFAVPQYDVIGHLVQPGTRVQMQSFGPAAATVLYTIQGYRHHYTELGSWQVW